MTKVNFYILQDSSVEARWHFTCRLADKAVRSGHRTLIIADTEREVQHLDDLLWTFKPETFITHTVFDPHLQAGPAATPAVAIATAAVADHHLHEYRGLLINLAREVPPWFSRFERLGEVVTQEPEILKNTRAHFSFFRERGYPIEYRHI